MGMICTVSLLLTCLWQYLCFASEDMSDVTWAHAVNSVKSLEEAIEGDIDIVEADVLLGRTSRKSGIPIMSHPPKNRSDISLEEWLDIFIESKSQKGIKLDFKSTQVLEPALKILEKRRSLISVPLWLNADIMKITGNANSIPVNASTFLTLCKTYFPTATLSLGWTTRSGIFKQKYTWEDVSEMSRTIRCHNITQPITFAVRGNIVGDSLSQLLWLVRSTPNSTFTVWSSVFDILHVGDLLKLRRSLPVSRIYYDLPRTQNALFQLRKKTVKSPESDDVNFNLDLAPLSNLSWNCRTETIIGGRTIMYGGNGPIVIVHDSASNKVKIQGRILPYVFDGNDTMSTLKMRLNLIESHKYLGFDSWMTNGYELLSLESYDGMPKMHCNISFYVEVGKDRKSSFTYNSGCPYKKMTSPSPLYINGDATVGLLIGGSRPAVIESFTVTRSGAISFAFNYIIIFNFIFTLL